MKSNSKISIKAHKDKLVELEKFIEDICIKHNIYDIQFAKIFSANTMLFELLCDINQAETKYIDYFFEQKKKCLYFKIKVNDNFIDVLKYLTTTNVSDTDIYEGNIKMNMIGNLADKIEHDYEKEQIDLIFYITGVNEMLTDMRIEMLKKYYTGIENVVRQ